MDREARIHEINKKLDILYIEEAALSKQFNETKDVQILTKRRQTAEKIAYLRFEKDKLERGDFNAV